MNELVKLAAERQGIENPNQLWEAIGGARQTAYNIWEGKSKPKYDTTMLLMKMAGLITDEKYLKLTETKVETALFRRRLFALNIKVNQWINPKKINYLRNIEVLKNNGQNIHYAQLLNGILLVKLIIRRTISYLFSIIRLSHITV